MENNELEKGSINLLLALIFLKEKGQSNFKENYFLGQIICYPNIAKTKLS
ncbi:hypothetical protein FLACOL_00772 [Flavobacterium columnare]|uniref:Uncharacterized protein n=1 Tax=Flavobacterium columnare TaxID=996 RepID=A0A2N9P8X4_9FLAO|nr:hypothetical protein FLACOL_00772 [Flavobacterium columnare]